LRRSGREKGKNQEKEKASEKKGGFHKSIGGSEIRCPWKLRFA
jgi:hypothetical protein